jgi:hypothetical protein
MTKPIAPDYAAPKVEELRALWRKYPNDEALRRTVKEVERLRQVMERIHADVLSIERAWKAEELGTLAGLHVLKILIADERRRGGRFGPLD